MKSKQVLDVQQMQHLQELGLDTSNASLCYYKQEGWEANYFIALACDIKKKGGLTYYYDSFGNKEYILNEVIPAYILQDVLDLLPKSIGVEYIYDLCIFPESISYTQFIGGEINDNLFAVPINESLIDAAYYLLCWAIENGFVETNKNE